MRIIKLPVIIMGNTALQPEIADTLTFGVICSLSRLSGFNASVDYYDIKIQDAIGAIDIQTAVDQCYAGVATACALGRQRAGRDQHDPS